MEHVHFPAPWLSHKCSLLSDSISLYFANLEFIFIFSTKLVNYVDVFGNLLLSVCTDSFQCTGCGGRVDRARVSLVGDREFSVQSNEWLIQFMLFAPKSGAWHEYNRGRTGLFSVRTMCLSRVISQWVCITNLPWVCTVTRLSPSSFGFKCCKNVKPKKLINLCVYKQENHPWVEYPSNPPCQIQWLKLHSPVVLCCCLFGK